MTKKKVITKRNSDSTVVADVTQTFTNPISGQEETKIGGQFVTEGLNNRIDLKDDAPRYDDGDNINYIAKHSNGDQAHGTYSLTGLLNEISAIVKNPNNIVYDKVAQTIHVTGRFNVKESINIHQPPHNIIRVVGNVMKLKNNEAIEKPQGVYGGY